MSNTFNPDWMPMYKVTIVNSGDPKRNGEYYKVTDVERMTMDIVNEHLQIENLLRNDIAKIKGILVKVNAMQTDDICGGCTFEKPLCDERCPCLMICESIKEILEKVGV